MCALAWLLLLAASPAAADGPPAAPHPVRLEPASQLKDISGIPSALAKPFAEPYQAEVGRPPQRRILRTCAELGGDFPAGLTTPDPADQRPLLFERVHCRALLWLHDARPSRQTFLGDLPLTLETARALPEDLVPRLGVPRKPRAKARLWKVADPKLGLKPNPPPRAGLYLKGRGYDARLSIYARGDFDADGIEDVLIRRDGFASGGSYQEFGLFLLTRPAAGAPFKVVRSFSEGY